MTYIEQFEVELTKKLAANEDTATIIRWLSGKILESYKNGLAAGRKRATAKHQGKNKSSPAQAQ